MAGRVLALVLRELLRPEGVDRVDRGDDAAGVVLVGVGAGLALGEGRTVLRCRRAAPGPGRTEPPPGLRGQVARVDAEDERDDEQDDAADAAADDHAAGRAAAAAGPDLRGVDLDVVVEAHLASAVVGASLPGAAVLVGQPCKLD